MEFDYEVYDVLFYEAIGISEELFRAFFKRYRSLHGYTFLHERFITQMKRCKKLPANQFHSMWKTDPFLSAVVNEVRTRTKDKKDDLYNAFQIELDVLISLSEKDFLKAIAERDAIVLSFLKNYE